MEGSTTLKAIENTVADRKNKGVDSVTLLEIEDWIKEFEERIDRRKERDLMRKKQISHWEHTIGVEQSKSHQYNSIIFVAGYAAFFTIWSSVGSIIDEQVKLFSFITLSCSLLIFVFYEVFCMIERNQKLKLQSKIFVGPDEEFDQRLEAAQKEIDLMEISDIPMYNIQLALTIIPGLISGLSLAYGMMKALLNN